MEHTLEHEPCRNCYRTRGCRCRLCTRAATEYEYQLRIKRRNPNKEILFVDASRARNHLIFLTSNGVGVNAIRRRTGLHTTTLSLIRDGRRTKITKPTERTIVSQALGMYEITKRDANAAKAWVKKLNLPKYKLMEKDYA